MKKCSRIFIAATVAFAGLVGYADLPNWTVVWTNEAQTVGLCSNDQNSFVLNVYRDADKVHQGFGLAIGIKSATKGSAVASVDGLGYLDLRGPISGLDPRVDPATNAVWKFSRFTATCFCPNDGTAATPAQYIVGLHSPGTLVSDTTLDTFHIDSGTNPKNTKEIIIDEPDVTTKLGGWYLNSVGGLTNLIYRLPKATLWSGPTSHGATSWKTDLGLWDVSGVKNVGSDKLTSELGTYSGPFASGSLPGATGVLRLPSLVNISSGVSPDSCVAFLNLGLNEVELGLSGNLVYLASYSFKNCNNLTNVVIGASPVGKTLTICTNAFWCTSLKTIYFNGEKPDIKGRPECPSFGTRATAEGQITFYVRDSPSWADVLAEADANGGFVSAATMGTANRQKVVRFSGFHQVAAELQDPRFADVYHETVTATMSDGRERDYHHGPVTLTATCAEPDDAATDPRRAHFLRWDGVPVALERQNPLTYVPTKSGVVRAVFAHDWVMSDDAEPNRTMDNRIWCVSCYKCSEADRRLGIGKANSNDGRQKGAMYPFPAKRKGGGDLNLNGAVWDVQGLKWTVVQAAGMSVWTNGQGKISKLTEVAEAGELGLLPTRLTLPETLLYWPGEIQNYDSWDNSTGSLHWPIEEVIGICPKATGNISGFSIGGCCYIKRLVIRAPKVTSFAGVGTYGFAWTGSSFSGSNFDEWDLTGVTTIPDNAFHGAVDYAIPGTLRFPKVTTVASNAFSRLTKVTSIELGSPTNLSVTTIANSAFARTTSLTNLLIGTKGLSLGTDSVFAGLKSLKTLHFPGRVLPQGQVDAILAAVPESAVDKQVTIYASPFSFWDSLADVPTDDEAAVKPADCFGVYRAGSRKAWFVTERSDFEPKGCLIILR